MITDSETYRRPRLRPEIVLGPAQRRGGRVVHHVKDPVTGCYYRIGPREYFLLSRMDGRRSTDELAAEYADEFGRKLTPESWAQLFGMLHSRQLLAGATDEEALARLAAAAEANAARAKRTLLLARLPLFDPERLFNRVGPWLAPLFSWWFVVPALLVVGLLAGLVIHDWSRLLEAVGESRSAGWSIVWAVLIAWVTIFLHECAHGLTCWHFGGRAKEIGLLWRFPLLAPYCNVDDVVVLGRRQRVATAFAGVFVSMLALTPFAVLWVLTERGMLHNLAGTILIFGTVTAAINLVPFLRLDGYYMLTHALNLVDLRGDTYRFWRQLLRDGPSSVAGYLRRDRIAYGLYGLASVVFGVAVVTLLVRLWYSSLRIWVGPVWAVSILSAEGVLVMLLVWYGVRRAKRKRGEAASGSVAPA
jgi:hypothetical protein